MCSCWKSADWFDKILGLQPGSGIPSVALRIGYTTGSRKHRTESAERLAYATPRRVTWAVMATGAQKEK